jgi:hypothetical protein
LRVRVSGPGRLRVQVTSAGRRRHVLDSATRDVRRAGTIGVPLRLPKAMRLRLHRGARLLLSLSVSYSDVAGSQHAAVTLVDRSGR